MSPPRLYRVEAVVLKRRNTGEADRLITLFTKERGKIVAMAKGIRRLSSKRAPFLEVFSRTTILLYKGQKYDTITEVSPIAPYAALRKHLDRISAAYVLCESIDILLPEHQEHPDVYGQMIQALGSLEQADPSREFLSSFLNSLLVSLGFLTSSKDMQTSELIAYIEQLTERRMKTKKIVYQLS